MKQGRIPQKTIRSRRGENTNRGDAVPSGSSVRVSALSEDFIANLEAAIAEERLYDGASVGSPSQTLHGLAGMLKSIVDAVPPDGKDQAVAVLLVSQSRAREWRSAVQHGLSVETDRKYLRAAVAQAIIDGRDRKAELKHRRAAMRKLEGHLLRVDLNGPRRQSRFDAFAIIRAYVTLRRGRGRKEFEYRSLQAMANRKERLTMRCPVTPREALETIADLYGFRTWRATLRYLIEQRKRVRHSEPQPGLSKKDLHAFLEDLPYVQGDEP